MTLPPNLPVSLLFWTYGVEIDTKMGFLRTDASAAGLPTASADGTVSMTLHQVNGDGAG